MNTAREQAMRAGTTAANHAASGFQVTSAVRAASDVWEPLLQEALLSLTMEHSGRAPGCPSCEVVKKLREALEQ